MAINYPQRYDDDFLNTIKTVIDHVNIHGKTIQDLVAEGQLTEEQYESLIITINGLLKSGEVNELDLTKELRAEIGEIKNKIDAGNVTEEDITGELKLLVDTIPNKISHGNVSVEDIDKNKGKFDGTWFSEDFLRDLSNAEINTTNVQPNSLTTEKYVNESVTKNKRTVGGGLALVTFRGAKPNLNLTSGERGLEMNSDFTIFHEKGSVDIPGGVKIEFAAGHNTLILYDVKAQTFRGINGQYMHLVRDDEVIIADIQFQDHYQNAVQQVAASFDYTVEGMSSTEANSITHRELSDSSVTESKTNFLNIPNYFDKEKATRGQSVASTTGEFTNISNQNTSEKLPIKGEHTLYLKGVSVIVCYDYNDEYITGWLTNSDSTTYTTDPKTEYIIVSVRNDNLDGAMVYIGDQEKPYEPFNINIAGHNLIQHDHENTFFPPEEIEARFFAPENYNYQRMTLAEYNQAFDELVNNFPERLEKTILGKDESGLHDVIQYHYKPVNFGIESGRIQRTKPKIIFISNVHGFEEPSALATYYMIKTILEDWRGNKSAEYLRNNVEMIFIAIANPYGYENGTYKNGNTTEPVNIQTNFSLNWLQRDPTSTAYGGEEPMSESETLYIDALIKENTDALFFVDVHTSGSVSSTTEDRMFYFIAPSANGQYNPIIEEALKYSVENASRELSKNYLQTYEGLSGYYYLRVGNGVIDAYASSLGVPGYVAETFYSMPSDTSQYSPTSIKAGTETFANSLLTTLKTFKERL